MADFAGGMSATAAKNRKGETMTHNTIAKPLACATTVAVVLPLMVATETVDGITWNYTVSNGKSEILV